MRGPPHLVLRVDEARPGRRRRARAACPRSGGRPCRAAEHALPVARGELAGRRCPSPARWPPRRGRRPTSKLTSVLFQSKRTASIIALARVAAWRGRILWAVARAHAVRDPRAVRLPPRRDDALRARRARADPARLADRRSDRARRRAHRPGHRRLPERELRQRAGADHRAVRRRGRPAGRRARLARPARSSRTSCSCSAPR